MTQGSSNPYQSETKQNTDTSWLDDVKPVKADLAGMTDYAGAVKTIGDNLYSHQTRVINQMQSLIQGQAFGGGFPEIAYAATTHGRNLTEFTLYLKQLSDGIQHVASAAQVVADSYGDADGFSAIDLNAVQFAFGFPDADRPSGLSSFVQGKTFSEYQEEQDEAAAKAAAKNGKPAGHPDSVWTLVNSTTDANGNQTSTYYDQYGDERTISVTTDAQGRKVTTITGPEGTVTTTDSTLSNPYVTTTTSVTQQTDPKTGKTTTSTSTSTSYSTGNGYTTVKSTNGKVESQTTTTYSGDSSTVTTYAVDGKGNPTHESQSVTVGTDNDIDTGTPDDPGQDAAQPYEDKVTNKTVTLAPGAPGSHPSNTATA